MPTYDYLCDKCEHAFELFQQMSDPVKRKCPECGTMKLRRLIGTGAGVLFKGSGFYETDYRSDSYKKAADADSKPAKSSDSDSKKKSGDGKKSDAAASTGKSESKPKSDNANASKKKPSGDS